MRPGAGHHGSAELGSVSRGRERDRGRGGSTQSGIAPMVTDSVIGDPLRQAQAYRSTPVGPQEAEEWAGALDTVINRLVSIEAAQRKHAAVLSKHEECLQHHYQQNDWLKRHADNCYTKVDNNSTEVVSRFDTFGGLINEITAKVISSDEAIEALKNMTAQTLAAINHMSASGSQGPATYNMATPQKPVPEDIPPVPNAPVQPARTPFDDNISLP